MRSLVIAIAFLLMLPMIGHGYNIPFNLRAGDCGAHVCISVQDFDGTNCLDSDAGGEGERACTNNGGNDNCTTSPCPLEGTESGRIDEAADFIHGVVFAARTSGELTMDFIFEYDCVTTCGAFTAISFARVIGSGIDAECRMRMVDTTTVAATNNNFDFSGNITVAENTKYWGRLQYNLTDDQCRLILWSDDWGGTEVGDVETITDTGGVSVISWQFEMPGGTHNLWFDAIAICEGDLSDGTTICTD